MTRKAKAHLEFNLAGGVKDNKKGFFKYTRSKRKTRKNVDLLLNGAEAPVIKNFEKAEFLNTFFSSVFTYETSLLEPWTFETREEVQKKENFLEVEET